jgi:hypothetical protein
MSWSPNRPHNERLWDAAAKIVSMEALLHGARIGSWQENLLTAAAAFTVGLFFWRLYVLRSDTAEQLPSTRGLGGYREEIMTGGKHRDRQD